MAKKDKKTLTKEDIVTTPKRKILYEGLKKGLNIKQSAELANLSYYYAKNIVAKSGMNALVLRETNVKTVDLREKVTKRLTRIVDSPEAADRDIIKASDVLGKMNGWQSSTLNLEAPKRQEELTAIERMEAQRLAMMRFNALPGEVIDAECTDNQHNEASLPDLSGDSQDEPSLTGE